MIVHKNAAWLFTSTMYLMKFDLIREQWSMVCTEESNEESWSATVGIAADFCMEIFEGKIYIFGGSWLSVFYALDLKTLCWTKLHTLPSENSKVAIPTARSASGSWIVPEERRMYILFGRYAYTDKNRLASNASDYHFDDMWSYSFDEGTWRLERLCGNFPLPHTYMACAYNLTLNQVSVYGGYNGQLLTRNTLPEHTEDIKDCVFNYSFYGDTFIMDMDTLIWKQVVTPTFPLY